MPNTGGSLPWGCAGWVGGCCVGDAYMLARSIDNAATMAMSINAFLTAGLLLIIEEK
jgi:hypothetical protein